MINQENTYLGADGLAYCKICGEPVEAFFPPDSILGMKKHFRQCACIRQKREVEEKAYKEREHRELVERNRKICFEEPRMYDWNFELAEKTTTIEKAKEYTANWNDMKKNHIGFCCDICSGSVMVRTGNGFEELGFFSSVSWYSYRCGIIYCSIVYSRNCSS